MLELRVSYRCSSMHERVQVRMSCGDFDGAG